MTQESKQPGWAHTGSEEAKQERAARERRRSKMQEFRLKPGEFRMVLFLEDVHPKTTFGCFRHKLRLTDDFRDDEEVTCSKGFAPCEVCTRKWEDGGRDRRFGRGHVNVATVVDFTSYIGEKDGKPLIVPAQKRLFVMKEDVFDLVCGTATKLRERKGDKEGLKMWLVDVGRMSQGGSRNQERSYAVGNSFEPIAKITDPFEMPETVKLVLARDKEGKPTKETAHPGCVLPDGKPMDLKPFDYYKLFEPPTKEALEKIFNTYDVSDGYVFGGKGGGRKDGQDEEVPAEAGGTGQPGIEDVTKEIQL